MPLILRKAVIQAMSTFRHIIGSVYKYIKMFLSKLRHDTVSAYAANAAFFILVSIFPFLILTVTIVNAILPESQFALSELMNGIPQFLSDFLSKTLSEAENAVTGTVLSVAAVSTLWAASKGLFALMYGLNTIADTDETRSYFFTRSLAIIYTLGLIVTLILTFVLLIFGNIIYTYISEHFQIFTSNGDAVKFLRYLFGALLLTSFFTILYTFVPNRHSTLFRELPGAICSTAGWIGFSAIYSLYIDHFTNFTIYGSFSAIVLLMLWLYFCMYILLIGAEINKFMRPLFGPIVSRREKKAGKKKKFTLYKSR